MTVDDCFESHFSKDNLRKIYYHRIVLSKATGVDNLPPRKILGNLDHELSIAERKALLGSYAFSKYKLALISKGRGKAPREISIPTARDRIVMRALCDFLLERHKEAIDFYLPQQIIRLVASGIRSGKYDSFIKLDVSNFYPSIEHQELEKRLRKRIRSPRILNLIRSAIESPTVSKPSPYDQTSKIGVPQGLSISNILAAIYLSNIDKRYRHSNDFLYFRFVDDILILCKSEDSETLSRDIITRFRKIKLKIHDPISRPEKSQIGRISEDFSYLGYRFFDGLISTRTSSINKLKDSIVSIFTSYKYSKHKNLDFLLWRLNLRVTGCIFQNKAKGWMFFFSEINDETTLHILDLYVQKLTKRFRTPIEPKRFVRSYYEIRHSKYETNYIPNFDRYSLHEMKEALESYFGFSTLGLTEDRIIYEFRKRIDKQSKDLLTDVQDFGY